VPFSRYSRRLSSLWTFVLVLCVPAERTYGQKETQNTSASLSAKDSNGNMPFDRKSKMDKRAFGIFPNYRSADLSEPFHRMETRQKFTLAYNDSFDWPLFAVAAGYAGLGQLTSENPSFGQGATGYFNRYVRTLSDLVIGNVLTEGVMASLFAEDPRYFRNGKGRFWARIGYASSRIFLTRTDSGATRFNCSEIFGNSTAVGISTLYYPDRRSVGDVFGKLTILLAADAFSNLLKEFWPDVKRKLSGRHRSAGQDAIIGDSRKHGQAEIVTFQ